MNIKDLPKNSYTVVTPQATPALNIKDLPKGSFTTVAGKPQEEATKTGVSDFLFPNVKKLSSLVTSSEVMKDPAYQGLLKSQEQILKTENNLRSKLLTEKNPVKIKGLQEILNSTVNQKLVNQAEIDKISKPQMASNASKAGTALGVGLDLGLAADLPLAGANLLKKPLMNVAPKIATNIAETFGKRVGPDLTKLAIEKAPAVLQPAMTKTAEYFAPKITTEAERLAFKAKPFTKKAGQIMKETIPQAIEGAGIGYGYDVSQGLQNNEGAGAFKPGAMTVLGGLIPAGIAGVRVAVQPLSALSKTIRSFGTPTEEMIKVEQSKLKGAYDSAFKMRESTDAKNTFLKSQGKQPSEVLAKYGLVPDTEYVNGKTVMRTKSEGGAVDEASNLIGNRGQQIQSTLDNVEKINPAARISIDQIETKTLANAKASEAGIDLIPIQNQIKTRIAGLRAKYGDTIGVGRMNIERIATNKGTKAWLKPQFELDADAVLGNTFRKYIDDVIDDPIVRQVNGEIGDLIAARKMLMAIDGKNIGGGRFTNVIASATGALLGTIATPNGNIITSVISSLASALGVKMLLRMLQRGEFGGQTTKRILQYLAEDKGLLNKLISKEPKLIQEAFLREIKASMGTKLLSAPKKGTNAADIFVPMEMRGATTYEPPAKKITTSVFNPKNKTYYEKGVMGGQRSIKDNTAKQITKEIKNPIPPIIPSTKTKSRTLLPKKPNSQAGVAKLITEKKIEIPGVKKEDIISVRKFGSSVEGKKNPNDFDHFVIVKDGSMKFSKKGGLTNPIIKTIGKDQYFIMPETDGEDLLQAMLYTGRKDTDRGYSGKTIDVTNKFKGLAQLGPVSNIGLAMASLFGLQKGSEYLSKKFPYEAKFGVPESKQNKAEVTMYNPVKSQTDKTPHTMASGKHIYDGAIATSDYSMPLGTLIKFDGDPKTYVVEDRMNRRFSPEKYGKIVFDILNTNATTTGIKQAKEFGRKNMNYTIVGHDGRKETKVE